MNYVDFYWTAMKNSIIVSFQYRVAQYFYMLGMIAEPIIYLVVWTSIASANGSINGYDAGKIAAYYIVWTLVRNMNIVFTPYGWEFRIKEGRLTGDLLRPIHPIHNDIATFGGMKIVVIVLWLPIALILALIFKPILNPTLMDLFVFFIAIWGAYLIRTMFLSILGMITFWTTRVSALYQFYFAVELLFSGRLVPMTFLPQWMQNIAVYLPFQYTFYMPIEALIGNLPVSDLLFGLAMQVFWIVVGAILVNIVWKYGIRQFTSVGN